MLRGVFTNAKQILASTGELYRNLSGLQRVAFVVVAVTVLGALVALASAGPEGDRDGERQAGAPSPGLSSGDPGAVQPTASWGSSWLLTPGQRQVQLQQANIAELERNIPNEKVERARIVYTPSRGPRRVLEPDRGDSAAVRLDLREGVQRLERVDADAIREQVACGLNLEPNCVSIIDHHGTSYPASARRKGPAGLYDNEEDWRNYIRETLEEYYANMFQRSEFYIGVIVYVSQEDVKIEREEYDPEKTAARTRTEDMERIGDAAAQRVAGGIGRYDPAKRVGSGRSLKSTVTEEFETSKATIHRTVPRGTLNGVRVTVLLDRDAVQRQLQTGVHDGARAGLTDTAVDTAVAPAAALRGGARDRLEELASAFCLREESHLREFLGGYKDATVRVLTQDFQPSTAKPEPANLVTAGVAPQLLGRAAGGGSLPFGAILALAALAVGVVVAGGMAARRMRARRVGEAASIPAGGTVPSVLSGGVRSGFDEALRQYGLRAGGAAAGGTAAGGSAGGRLRGSGHLGDGLLRTVSDTSSRVKRRPEVAAAVLRFWLSEDADQPPGGTHLS